jgi:hypothetical protein
MDDLNAVLNELGLAPAEEDAEAAEKAEKKKKKKDKKKEVKPWPCLQQPHCSLPMSVAPSHPQAYDPACIHFRTPRTCPRILLRPLETAPMLLPTWKRRRRKHLLPLWTPRR